MLWLIFQQTKFAGMCTQNLEPFMSTKLATSKDKRLGSMRKGVSTSLSSIWLLTFQLHISRETEGKWRWVSKGTDSGICKMGTYHPSKSLTVCGNSVHDNRLT